MQDRPRRRCRKVAARVDGDDRLPAPAANTTLRSKAGREGDDACRWALGQLVAGVVDNDRRHLQVDPERNQQSNARTQYCLGSRFDLAVG